MNNVYIVTSGEYSAYCISAVFSEKELAQKYIDSFEKPKWDSYFIEEYDLNPYAKEIKKGYLPYFVKMSKNGDCIDVRINKTDGLEYNELLLDSNNNVRFSLFAKDEKHAIKIANEKRIQLIVNNVWK
jgi:hypothetical protein